ncbi:MAG: 7-cyano-7-deazaguanine synthase QueC [Myxococcota bacterium]
MSEAAKKAVVLLSGGLDSSTTLAIARQQGFAAHAMSFAYGQRQAIELEAARQVAAAIGVEEHRMVSIDLASYGGSALTTDIEVPKDRSEAEIGRGVPVTYVPARNTVFLAHALAWAEVLGAFDIFIGVNAVDYSGYPDCRPAFIQAFENLANVATGTAITGLSMSNRFKIHAPLIRMTKAEIIRKGIGLGVDFAVTVSCYDPTDGMACGHCDACLLRRKGFEAANVADPTPYAQAPARESAAP